MIRCSGKSALKGIAIGKMQLFWKQEYEMKKVIVEDTGAEQERFLGAKETASRQLEELYQAALKDVGEEQAMIFKCIK